MRKTLLSIAIFLFSLTSVMGQLIPITLPADGNWPTIVGDSIMIIGPRQNELTEEQRYFNPIYLMVYPGKEHLKEQMIRAGACDCDLTKPNRRIGVFSVAPNKQVSFSQGNLQYLPAINLWKFADTQYEYLGNANKYLKPTFRNWVDLFGWSANNTTAPFGVSTSTNAADYAGDFVDWGTNTICGDAPGTWRTLSVDEWEYLFKKRTNAAQLYSKGSIEGIRGMIVLSDNWALPEGVQFTVDTANLTMALDLNAYSFAEWQKMEDAGAVFLCVTGRRDGKVVGYLQEYGGYWTNSRIGEHVYHLYYNYNSSKFITDYHLGGESYGVNGRSVRLVHDTIVPTTEPEYVDLGLSVKWATFNVGATKPEEYGDYFAWGETETKDKYSWTNYKWCDGTDRTMTKYCSDSEYGADGFTDSKTILEPEDDAAHVHWGGKWRMPSDEEFTELREKCTWTWVEQNGINGYIVKGPNDNTIFMPIGGYMNGTSLTNADLRGYYWSSSIDLIRNRFDRTCIVSFDSSKVSKVYSYRRFGLPIRPVYDDRPPKRIGVFSVAADKQVSFSQGNLQYTQSTDEWRFAREQYEYIGADNIQNSALADRIDLFGWSTNNPQSTWGLIFTQSNKYYSGTFVDWGNNLIMGDIAKTWRTLSLHEWTYLLTQRENANNLYTYANINGTNGLVLLPDKWETIDEIPINIATDYSANTFSLAQWETLETRGAVFLPSCGVYMGNNYNHETAGLYWTNTPDESDETKSHCLYVTKSYVDINYSGNRSTNRSVRLVHDTIVLKAESEYVDLGLSVKWATFNVGATSPEDYGDYFAWGETETKDKYSWATYKWCDGTSTNMTKYNTEDGKTILEPADDAAQVHWGGKWRMPSKEEVDELTQQCNWIWTTHNNVNGYKVTGPNGNSIFLPAAGYKGGGPTYPAGEDGLYWTNTIEKQHYSYLIVLHNDAPPTQVGRQGTRCFGFTIRPVYDDRPPKRIGVFSVAADKQVSFSQGNLQYVQSTDTWQFAANQLEYMGHKHYRNGQLADTIEYFGWSGKNSKTPWGISLSTESSDYEGEFLDWGINTIAGSAPNTWRTLSNDEWLYICQGRKNADQLLGLGKISSIFGLIILPDDWVAPEGITFTPNDNNPDANVYSLQQWTAMEEAGAIFIPPTGYFNHDIDNMRYVGTYGYARNNTLTANGLQIYTLFKPSEIQYSRSAEGNNGNLYYAFPQRLVHDTIVPKPEPEYVDLGLSVKWATFNVGATSPNEIGNFYAWGEIEPKDTYTVNNYKWWNKTSKETTKYCTIDSLAYGGVADGLTELQPQDDIAHTLKGEHWRMPNLEECKELGNGCTWTVSTRQGQIGFEGTSKINGNTIFLPVVGFRAGANLVYETLGGYWSSTLNIEKQSCAMGLYLNRETPSVGIYYNSSRQNGFLIRPVYDDRVE